MEGKGNPEKSRIFRRSHRGEDDVNDVVRKRLRSVSIGGRGLYAAVPRTPPSRAAAFGELGVSTDSRADGQVTVARVNGRVGSNQWREARLWRRTRRCR